MKLYTQFTIKTLKTIPCSAAPYRPNKGVPGPPGELFYLAGVFCRTLYTSLQLCRGFLWAHECFASESAMLKLQKRGENEASQKTQYRNQTFTIIIIIVVVVVVVLNIRICSNINLRVTIFTLPNLPSSLYQRWQLQ